MLIQILSKFTVRVESKSDLGPGQVGLLARPGPAEAEAVKASVRVGPGETEGARFAGGALHALHVGLARAVAVGIRRNIVATSLGITSSVNLSLP